VATTRHGGRRSCRGRRLDPELVVRVAPLEANLDIWRRLAQVVSTLAASLGAVALVLAVVAYTA